MPVIGSNNLKTHPGGFASMLASARTHVSMLWPRGALDALEAEERMGG